MTKEEVKAVLDRVLTWPPQRQEDAAALLKMMEENDASSLQLTDEQVAEVRRRRADTDEPTLTLEEFDARLRRRGI